MTEKRYYYNGKNVSKPRSVIYEGSTYTPPTDELLTEIGYEIREEEIIISEPKITYEELVISLIRQKYTINQELAILRQRDTKPDEFEEYNTYCEECKAKAKEETA